MTEEKWKREVKKRDRYMCRRCGIDENLEAHHILPKKKYSRVQRALLNGITLCGNCHWLITSKEMKIDLRGFLPNDSQIDKQLSDLLKRVELLRIKIPQNVKITLRGEITARDVAKRFYDLA